jgi:hypothetical protein
VEKKVVVRNFLECLDHLCLTLALDLEDVGDLVNISVILVFNSTSIIDVSSYYLVLWIILVKSFNLDVHSIIDIINRVHFLLFQKGSQ